MRAATPPERAGGVVSLLEVADLHVWFDLPARRSAACRPGRELRRSTPASGSGLVGESGCGKTTALLALMGLLPPTAEVAGRGRR